MASGKGFDSSTEVTESQPDVTTQLESDANKKTYNILLIGETGVGKSTFINAFFYYLTYESLDDALKAADITALVPTRFTIMDNDYNQKHIVYGEDENESVTPGASATKSPRSYTFKIGNSVIRLIDTPGVGDTEGTNKDAKNFDRLFATIGELEDIHAICITLKPNNSRLTVLFQYCINQLLSRLQRSASRNIVFLFTNSRSTLYRPGDTMVPLQKVIKEIAERPPNVLIPFHKKNIFCIDNEAFRFLIANKQGIHFNDAEKEDFAASWNKSSEVCLSLLNYIVGLKPHKIQDTVSINEARRLILKLSQPLAEITEHIDNNLEIIRGHKVNLSDGVKTIEELKNKLYVPVITVEVIPLRYPRTVCAHPTCVDFVWSNENTRTCNYRTVCHEPCYLREVEKLVDDRSLIYCDVMSAQNCRKCGHHYTIHVYTTYTVKVRTDRIKDEKVVSAIKNRVKITENDMKYLRNTIQSLEERKLKYESERTIIQKSMAKFAHFLNNSAITVYNDKYNEYLDLLIDRENSLGDARDKKAIERYTKLKTAYAEEKKIFDDILEQEKLIDSSKIAAVTAEEVMETVKKLCKLELTGTIVKDFCKVQDCAIKHGLLTEKTYTPPKDMIPKIKNKIAALFNKMF